MDNPGHYDEYPELTAMTPKSPASIDSAKVEDTGKRTVKVTSQGIQFGNAWYSHEKITGYTAEQLNKGNCRIAGREYMKWLNAAPRIPNATPSTQAVGEPVCGHCKCNSPMHDLDCPVAVAGLAANADACEVCKGTKGGVLGNENVIDGKIVCDYCHASNAQAAPTTGSVPIAIPPIFYNGDTKRDPALRAACNARVCAGIESIQGNLNVDNRADTDRSADASALAGTVGEEVIGNNDLAAPTTGSAPVAKSCQTGYADICKAVATVAYIEEADWIEAVMALADDERLDGEADSDAKAQCRAELRNLLNVRPDRMPDHPYITAPMTKERIQKIAETLGEPIAGESDYKSWGHGYRQDGDGAYTIPNVPEIAFEFAHALLANGATK